MVDALTLIEVRREYQRSKGELNASVHFRHPLSMQEGAIRPRQVIARLQVRFMPRWEVIRRIDLVPRMGRWPPDTPGPVHRPILLLRMITCCHVGWRRPVQSLVVDVL
jgi:hypothetical protein